MPSHLPRLIGTSEHLVASGVNLMHPASRKMASDNEIDPLDDLVDRVRLRIIRSANSRSNPLQHVFAENPTSESKLKSDASAISQADKGMPITGSLSDTGKQSRVLALLEHGYPASAKIASAAAGRRLTPHDILGAAESLLADARYKAASVTLREAGLILSTHHMMIIADAFFSTRQPDNAYVFYKNALAFDRIPMVIGALIQMKRHSLAQAIVDREYRACRVSAALMATVRAAAAATSPPVESVGSVDVSVT